MEGSGSSRSPLRRINPEYLYPGELRPTQLLLNQPLSVMNYHSEILGRQRPCFLCVNKLRCRPQLLQIVNMRTVNNKFACYNRSACVIRIWNQFGSYWISSLYCVWTNKIWLEVRLCSGRAAGGSNWAQLAIVNGILLVYSGEIVNRWHSAALFVGEGRRSQHFALLHIFIIVCHTAEVRSVLCPV